jgi:hypothetical protein
LDSLAPSLAPTTPSTRNAEAWRVARATGMRPTWPPRLRRLRAELADPASRRSALHRTGRADQTNPRVASALRRASCTLQGGADRPAAFVAPIRRTTSIEAAKSGTCDTPTTPACSGPRRPEDRTCGSGF